MGSRGLGKRTWRPALLPLLVVIVGASATLGSFTLERGAVRHADQALLRQYAVQGSLILSSFVAQTPEGVAQIAQSHLDTLATSPAWQAVAGSVARENQYSALSAVKAIGSRLLPVATVGTVHGRFGTPADAAAIASFSRPGPPYSAVVHDGSRRWLTQMVRSDTTPGFFVYSESPITDTLINLASLPGHPFAGIEGAVYVGKEAPENLVLSTTAHLPLSGERAVAVISSGTTDSDSPPRLSNRPDSVSDPGGFLLVIHPTQVLTGSPSAVLPWILLTLGLVLTPAVAGLLFISERRRLKLVATVASLEASNSALDRSVGLQESTAARFSAMVRSSSDLTTLMGADGRITYQSPSSSAFLNRSPESMLGTPFGHLLHPDDLSLWQGALIRAGSRRGTEVLQALRLRASTGSYVSVETRITDLLGDPAVAGIVLNSRDITEQQRLEDELRHQAFHDSLTGLANRALFEDRLDNALGRLSRREGEIGVLFLDLDDFKAVNDGRGHDVGDSVLQAVSDRLRAATRSGDTLARIGGDEFALLIECSDETSARETAERLKESLEEPLAMGNGQTTIRASIGLATTSNRLATAQELLRNADVAMYAAKNAGKDRIEVFHSRLHDEVIERLGLELDLGRALPNSELSVHYQLIVDLQTRDMVGVEALMRWEHPTRGTVMPADFIPVAESTGLIVGMGRWMLHQACHDLLELQRSTGHDQLRLSVNLSTKQLDQPDIVEHVEAALAESGLPPHLLTLELTESVFMDRGGRSHLSLQQLKALGVRLSIDDFGTGFSSLGYLERLPVDELKIDRSFVAGAHQQGKGSPSLVDAIVRLARDFGLETVAEGVETESQLDMIRQAGCQLAQGYLFARPVELSDLLSNLAGSDATGSRRRTPAARTA